MSTSIHMFIQTPNGSNGWNPLWIKKVIKARLASSNRRVKVFTDQLTHAQAIQTSWAEKLDKIQ